ncbi:cysteine hydrolase [Tumebacillus sp. ITR2]|uniref:Cysteine hydrolase n=1 Tax=Tumebacillus amylolyticus TaxID=2801339 RepID=A0ABS1JD31_9BACL|nr:isochorismatase family protein [Tumebacillus amylolyticus]MBL0388182.1 cysteine hydrolase [Tumebacillus amylolyticus]
MKKALIITDIQSDFLGNMDYIYPLCQKYLDNHAKEYDLVILTHWKHVENENENTLLLKSDGAKVIEKRGYSALTDEVKQLLQENNIELVHLGGIDSDMAVIATMYNLLDAGYKVQMLEGLLASYSTRNWESTTIMRFVLGDENVLNVGGGRVWM